MDKSWSKAIRPEQHIEEVIMRRHELRGIEINVPFEHAFKFISDPAMLPRWTNAFASANGERAILRTPAGEVEVGLSVRAVSASGTVDWKMRFPDGSSEIAYSRLVPAGDRASAYSFILAPASAALAELEGTLDEQVVVLERELRQLKVLLESEHA